MRGLLIGFGHLGSEYVCANLKHIRSISQTKNYAIVTLPFRRGNEENKTITNQHANISATIPVTPILIQEGKDASIRAIQKKMGEPKLICNVKANKYPGEGVQTVAFAFSF